MAGWLLLLPLLLFSCLQQVQLQTVVPDAELKELTSKAPPVTTFLPDPELSHTLEELIEESEKNSYEFVEGTVNRKVNNETNANNVTISITENSIENVEKEASVTISSQPQNTSTTTEKSELVIVPLTDKPNDTLVSTTIPQPTKEIEYDLISSTENTPGQSDISPVTKGASDISPVTKGPSDISPVTKGPSDISSVTKGQSDISPVTKGPSDISPVTNEPSDISPVTKGPSDISPVTKGASDISPVTNEPSDISPVTNPPPVSPLIDNNTSPVKKMRSRPPAWVGKIARPIIFPLLLAISWLFLGFLLACHIAVPKLRENTGNPFMGYIIALMLKATVTFCNIVFKHLHSPGFCFYAAAISYLKSLAMLFWVNIMVFDIWRKSRSLVQFKPSRAVAMWKYHLYGWGTPISLSLLSLLIEHLVPDEASWIIKPGFDNGYKCWFEDDEAQLLYLNTPVGILHISNVIMMVFTYRYLIRITDNAFIDDDQGAPGSTLPRDTAVPAAKRTDFISEFWFLFWILTFTVVQWVLWMIAQILQHFTGAWQLKIIPGFLIALQGVILFIIFMSNSGKRNILKENFPEIFERITGCWSKVQKSQNKLSISKSSVTSAAAPVEPQTVVGQTNPAFVEEENNVSYIALANINQNQQK